MAWAHLPLGWRSRHFAKPFGRRGGPGPAALPLLPPLSPRVVVPARGAHRRADVGLSLSLWGRECPLPVAEEHGTVSVIRRAETRGKTRLLGELKFADSVWGEGVEVGDRDLKTGSSSGLKVSETCHQVDLPTLRRSPFPTNHSTLLCGLWEYPHRANIAVPLSQRWSRLLLMSGGGVNEEWDVTLKMVKPLEPRLLHPRIYSWCNPTFRKCLKAENFHSDAREGFVSQSSHGTTS